jgi:hypothetical protein
MKSKWSNIHLIGLTEEKKRENQKRQH